MWLWLYTYLVLTKYIFITFIFCFSSCRAADDDKKVSMQINKTHRFRCCFLFFCVNTINIQNSNYSTCDYRRDASAFVQYDEFRTTGLLPLVVQNIQISLDSALNNIRFHAQESQYNQCCLSTIRFSCISVSTKITNITN